MRFHKRPSLRPLAFAAGALLLFAALWVIVGRGRPHVLEVFPAQDAFAIPAQAPVRVTFDRPMNTGAIDSAFSTDPARSGSFAWDGNTVVFTPDEPWPRGESISITVSAARGSSGLRQAEPHTWAFRTAPTLLAYLWPASATDPVPADLYALDPETGDVAQLTDTPYGVLDFTLSPDGLSILLSLSNDAGGADIAELDLISREITILLRCSTTLCSRPQYAPSGQQIAYENTTAGQVFLLDLSGESTRLAPGRFPSWSPDGRMLLYDPGDEQYRVFDLETGSTISFDNPTGEPASWGPENDFFLAPAFIDTGNGAFASHTIRYSLSRGGTTDLTRDPLSDDNAPVISPDGSMVALARRSLAPERWTPGRQLWVMSSDGQDAVPLTSTAVYHHTAFTWHPDNNQIAYLRSNQADLNEPPEIWMIAVDVGMPVRLVINGFAPAWIP